MNFYGFNGFSWNLGLGKYHMFRRKRFLLLIFRLQRSIDEYQQSNEECRHQFLAHLLPYSGFHGPKGWTPTGKEVNLVPIRTRTPRSMDSWPFQHHRKLILVAKDCPNRFSILNLVPIHLDRKIIRIQMHHCFLDPKIHLDLAMNFQR